MILISEIFLFRFIPFTLNCVFFDGFRLSCDLFAVDRDEFELNILMSWAGWISSTIAAGVEAYFAAAVPSKGWYCVVKATHRSVSVNRAKS